MKLERISWSEATEPSEAELRKRLNADGFDAFRYDDTPGNTYEPHSHEVDESLWVIDGEITFSVDGQHYRLTRGDRLMLPAQTVHSAIVGPAGASYLIGQRR